MREPYIKAARARDKEGTGERWEYGAVAPTLNVHDCLCDSFAVVLVVEEEE